MTPDDLRAAAVDMRERARRAGITGDIETAQRCRRIADELDAAADTWESAPALLTPPESFPNLPSEVTHVELARRGRQIAKGRGKDTDDPLWRAILASRWVSRERYAKERLRTRGNNLHRWMTGGSTVPRPVANKIAADFGIGDDYWQQPPRKGVAD